MVEKLTLNSLATALVDIPAFSVCAPSKHETFVALCCHKTAHFWSGLLLSPAQGAPV